MESHGNMKPISDNMFFKYNKLLRILKISHIIIENDNNNAYHHQLFNEMNNDNLYMLVIENMSLAIIMNKNVAFQFGYIRDVVDKYNSFKKILNYKINIVYIDKKWDTTKWDSYSLQRFHYMMSEIKEKTLNQLKNDRNSHLLLYSRINTYFLEALCWESPYKVTDSTFEINSPTLPPAIPSEMLEEPEPPHSFMQYM